jgi:hypothetical protein
MLDEALADINRMSGDVFGRLKVFRAEGGTDEDFIGLLVEDFVVASRAAPRGAGLVHMALSLYRMGLMADEITQLRESVEMRDDALRLMFDIQKL